MASASPASKKATTADDDRTQLPTPLQSPAPVGSRSSSGSSYQAPFPLETHVPSPSSDIEDADPLGELAETEIDDEGYTTALDPGNATATTTTTTVNSSALYHMRYRYGDRSTATATTVSTHRRVSSRGTSSRLCRHCGSLHRSHKHCHTVRVVHERYFTKDFFLIIVLCFVAAVLLICILRPPTIWISLYHDTLYDKFYGLHPDRLLF